MHNGCDFTNLMFSNGQLWTWPLIFKIRWTRSTAFVGCIYMVIFVSFFPVILNSRSILFYKVNSLRLIMVCRNTIAYKSREVLKRDGVTLLCWWGNIHKFCVAHEVTSYSQSMYLTIWVTINAWILLKIHVLSYRGCIYRRGSVFYWSVPNAGFAGKFETPEFVIHEYQILGASFMPKINLLRRLGIYLMYSWQHQHREYAEIIQPCLTIPLKLGYHCDLVKISQMIPVYYWGDLLTP